MFSSVSQRPHVEVVGLLTCNVELAVLHVRTAWSNANRLLPWAHFQQTPMSAIAEVVWQGAAHHSAQNMRMS